jgi:hypothetical protein
MKTLENIDIAKPALVCRMLNKPGCQFIARHGAMAPSVHSLNDRPDV